MSFLNQTQPLWATEGTDLTLVTPSIFKTYKITYVFNLYNNLFVKSCCCAQYILCTYIHILYMYIHGTGTLSSLGPRLSGSPRCGDAGSSRLATCTTKHSPRRRTKFLRSDFVSVTNRVSDKINCSCLKLRPAVIWCSHSSSSVNKHTTY